MPFMCLVALRAKISAEKNLFSRKEVINKYFFGCVSYAPKRKKLNRQSIKSKLFAGSQEEK